ncbi:MAG: hypothetical protein GW903_01120 [Alphaproteobacteria bacterium]|nr:hypothetical protein [Alphaproteobacteria bacterium]NCQ87571.1 hypothetical protein [Alphaproteobacteria bacterium]NCT06440.1 hypothetical protein [Alphaproteobacteria bacterium]
MNEHSKKFLFDIHNFDAPEEPEEITEDIIEDLPPPPPTFSESELEAAQAVSFSKGKQEGLSEERASRNQFIAGVLDQINNSFMTLFANEIYREKTYEQEALKLALKVIDVMAPTLQARLGNEAVIKTIKETIALQSKQSEILLEIPKGTAVEIDDAIQKIWPDPDHSPKYRILESDTLPEGECKLSWKDGGMVRNHAQTVEKMKLELEELLAQTDASVPTPLNNDIKNQDVSDDTPITEPQTDARTGEENDRSDG